MTSPYSLKTSFNCCHVTEKGIFPIYSLFLLSPPCAFFVTTNSFLTKHQFDLITSSTQSSSFLTSPSFPTTTTSLSPFPLIIHTDKYLSFIKLTPIHFFQSLGHILAIFKFNQSACELFKLTHILWTFHCQMKTLLHALPYPRF